MKKSLLRKVIAITLALTVALTMGVNVFAADQEDLGTDNTIKPNDTPTVISDAGVKQDGEDVGGDDAGKYGVYKPIANTVRIDKEIIVFNTQSKDTLVFLPNITYTYSIAEADVADGKYITDEYELKANIKDGVAAALTTKSATVSYSDANGIKTGDTTITSQPYVITTSSGVAAAGYFDITFDPTKFSKPGVYRYVISESTGSSVDAGRTAAAVTNDKDKYGDKRYLDVYVQYNKDDNTKLEIYGYALYEDSSNADKEFDAKPANRKLTAKTNGFVSNKNDDSTQAYDPKEKDVDIYQTANVWVEKNTTGAMGDKTNEFPFEVKVTNSTITSQAKFSYQIVKTGDTLDTDNASNPTKALNGSGTVTIGSASATVADNLKLKDKEYVYVYGIPGKGAGDFNDKYATVTKTQAKEYNNTEDTYTVSSKYNDADVNVTVDSETATSVNMQKAKVAAAAEKDLVFTKTEDKQIVKNNMSSISPTNVVTRYAPFLLILAAAILLLVIRRRRSSEEA